MDGSEALSDNYTTVKTRFSALVHNKDTLRAFAPLIADFNVAAKAAWLFARWIFLSELEMNQDWDPAPFITRTFFSEVLHTCIDCTRRTARTSPTIAAREIIARHQVAFFAANPFIRPAIAAPQQLCLAQATKMVTAYYVNIKLRLGNYIRHHINILGERNRFYNLTKKSARVSAAAKDVAKQHIQKLNRYLASLTLGYPNAAEMPQLIPVQRVLAATFLRCGPMPSESFFYDIKDNPMKYFKTMIDLNRLGLRTFQVFPISTHWAPLNVSFDLKSVVLSVLGGRLEHEYKNAAADPATWWSQHVCTNKRPWKAQSGRDFTRSFQTDGISVSVCKSKKIQQKRGKNKTQEERDEKELQLAASSKRKRDERSKLPKQTKGSKQSQEKEKDYPHITTIESTELMKDKGNTVLIDPGRGDLLYCMHEDSTPLDKKLYRYTADQRRKELKLKEFRKRCNYDQFPEVKAAMAAVAATSHRHTSLARFREYLAARSAASAVLTPFFAKKVHRETRWQSHRLQQQSDARLSKNLREKFGKDPLLVIGDHSSPNLRYQQPIRGVGMLRMLKRHKFRLLLLDEYNTSKICPGCDQINRCFQSRLNPRPWKTDFKLVHGLKQCDGCKPGSTKHWNRDLVATLNFRRIVQAQREGRPRPETLQRGAGQ